jgi:hypothetical protein
MFYPSNPDELAVVIEKIRQNRSCVYMGNKNHCDCKFGGDDLGTMYAGGESYGCPELRVCIQLLNNITDKEYKEIMNRK